MDKFNELKVAVEEAEEHAKKFDAGNKAAGTRLRKSMMTIIGTAKAVRLEVQEIKQAE